MFGGRLKELRLEKKINQAELGEIIGISPSTVGMYEREQRFPDKDTLSKIADYFEVSVDYLLGRTNERNIKNVTEDMDEDIRMIQRARNNMDKKDREKMIKVLKTMFDEYFD